MCRNPGRLLAVLSLVVGTLLAGCAAVPRERQLAVTPGASRPAAANITNYQDAVDAIVSVMTNDLQLPIPRTSFTVNFYPFREALAQGLIGKFNNDPTVAGDTAKFAVGSIRQTKESKQLLVNEQILERYGWPDRIGFLAHEITHIIHYELANKTNAGDQWLKEGFAEWVACRVTARLGLASFGSLRGDLIDELAGARFGLRHAPFEQLVTFPQWVEARHRYEAPLYTQAFLAAELLVEMRGVPAVVGYFQRFEKTQDRAGAFTGAFGLDPADFERAFARRWHETVSRARAQW